MCSGGAMSLLILQGTCQKAGYQQSSFLGIRVQYQMFRVQCQKRGFGIQCFTCQKGFGVQNSQRLRQTCYYGYYVFDFFPNQSKITLPVPVKYQLPINYVGVTIIFTVKSIIGISFYLYALFLYIVAIYMHILTLNILLFPQRHANQLSFKMLAMLQL